MIIVTLERRKFVYIACLKNLYHALSDTKMIIKTNLVNNEIWVKTLFWHMFLKYLLWWTWLLSFKFMWKQTHGKGQTNEKYEFGDFKFWNDRMFLKKKLWGLTAWYKILSQS